MTNPSRKSEIKSVLPKGTVVKRNGMPFELLEDVPVFGTEAESETARSSPAKSALEEQRQS